jgi:hypothetical protein
LLDLPLEIPDIASHILKRAILPTHAALDALHIATAAFHKVEYLLTWNCKHIANAQIIPKFVKLISELQLNCPTICTPEELLGDTDVR